MTFECTILKATPGKCLAKRYTDSTQPPDDYDAGALFTVREEAFSSFDAFTNCLASLEPDECLIRGRVKDAAQVDVRAGLTVRRLEYDKGADDTVGESLAAFEATPRNWIVLDVDTSSTPFDPSNVEASIDAWRATLPADPRRAKCVLPFRIEPLVCNGPRQVSRRTRRTARQHIRGRVRKVPWL